MRLIVTAAVLGGRLVAAQVAAGAADPPKNPQLPGFVKGYTWGWPGVRGDYLGAAPNESLRQLTATGTEWIALAFLGHMETQRSTEILFSTRNKEMITDGELRRAIRLARNHRFKIILKPVVDCRNGVWRALIDFPDKRDWESWWANYERFLLHYAKIAADTRCEMFCVGCEMYSTVKFEQQWRRVITAVRKVYKGPIVYNANTGLAGNIKWLDALDIIGVGAYYPVGARRDTSLEHMLNAWRPIRQTLRALSEKAGKPILFMEIGVRSAATCSAFPSDWKQTQLPYDGAEQARYYEAALNSFWNEPWFLGYCWWDWPARLYDKKQAQGDTSFCVYGKPAEQTLSGWYSKPRPAQSPRP
ncbi:MAG: hypothetical protein K1X71_09250 [Pirellulales bacterium]|nr:hypothetical protein [Pirellulales bacterium]